MTRLLNLDSLRPWKNPRGTKFDVSDLVESFDHAPQLQNVVVRRVAGTRERYEVISGNRRVAAAREKGWGHIEAKVVDVDDLQAEAYALEENVRRKALPNEARATARLVEIYELTNPTRRGGDHRSKAFRSNGQGDSLNTAAAKVARATGQSVREVRRKVRIAKLGTQKLQNALAAKTVNVLQAEKLAGLPPKQQELQLARLNKRKQVDPFPDVSRAIEALGYAEKTLRKRQPGQLRANTVNELRARTKSVMEAVELLGRAKGSRKIRHLVAAKSAQLPAEPKPKVRQAVHFEPHSYNRKLSPVGYEPHENRPRLVPMFPFVSTTTVSIQSTCPDSCVFKGAPGAPRGCYVDAGFTKIKMGNLDAAGEGITSVEVIAEEARKIDRAFKGGKVPQDGARGGRDLRLHVGGDVGSSQGAKLLGAAASRWKQRGGGSIWTFTHDWRTVPRSAWGEDISVLASVETAADIKEARKKGYAAAIVVGEFPNGDQAFRMKGSKANVVPCPAETRGRTCAECRLCLDRDLLRSNTAIAFALHGQRIKEARTSLDSAQP